MLLTRLNCFLFLDEFLWVLTKVFGNEDESLLIPLS